MEMSSELERNSELVPTPRYLSVFQHTRVRERLGHPEQAVFIVKEGTTPTIGTFYENSQ